MHFIRSLYNFIDHVLLFFYLFYRYMLLLTHRISTSCTTFACNYNSVRVKHLTIQKNIRSDLLNNKGTRSATYLMSPLFSLWMARIAIILKGTDINVFFFNILITKLNLTYLRKIKYVEP